jgi:hypothetical protein
MMFCFGFFTPPQESSCGGFLVVSWWEKACFVPYFLNFSQAFQI